MHAKAKGLGRHAKTLKNYQHAKVCPALFVQERSWYSRELKALPNDSAVAIEWGQHASH